MTDSSFLLTLDAGTGSGRAVLFDRDGRQVAVVQHEWSPREQPDIPGSQVFDTDQAWAIFTQAIRAVIARAGIRPAQVAGVTATSMREGFVLYDRAGAERWACFNGDARAAQVVTELQARGLGEGMYRRGGDWFGMAAAPRLLWIKAHEPELYARAARLTMLGDWVLWRLSGEYATDQSLGSSSALFDLEARTWCEETIVEFDLPRDIYPPVLESGTVLGRVTAAAAAETGLAEGTPVVISGADTQLALAGVGAVTPGAYTIVGGSFWQTTLVTARPLIDPEIRLRTLCHVLPGQWMTEGIGFLHGFATRWLRDGFGRWEREQAAARGVDAYVVLEELASTVPPGAHGLVPIFSDLMNARRWKQAAPSFLQIDILSPQTCGLKEFFRALEENAAYVAYGHSQRLAALGGQEARQLTFCGGSSKGFLWPQIVADVLGRPIHVPVVKEATALGAAMCVAVGLGQFADVTAAAQQWVSVERTCQPDAQAHAAYRPYYERWRRLYPRLLALVDEGLLAPLWSAPGA
ncbi:MAG: autoinducer-2 kinase [Anaerolineales bacterium]|nr:autoinducer-2 kinase [Anaerolineales bacterium]